MEIICKRENLLRGLSLVERCIGRDASLPILANVLITVENKRVKIATTDLERGVTCYFGGKIISEGAATVPARLFYDYVSNLSGDTVNLKQGQSDLLLSCDDFKATIKGLNVSDFPLIPKIETEPFCQIEAGELLKSLKQVSFAAARDESRPEIAGVYFGLKEGKVRLAATDSYRLAEKVIVPSGKINTAIEVIIPAKTVMELERVLPEEGGVEIYFSENQIGFKFVDSLLTGGEVFLISRLVEGQYPDYKQIIPQNFVSETTILKKELMGALKATSLFSRIDSSEVKLEIKKEGELVEISAESGQVGSNFSRVKGETKGEYSELITFNHRYLLEGLSNIGTDKIVLAISRENGPGVLRPAGEEDYIYLVMPIKN